MTETSENVSKDPKERKGDQPHPSKVEAKDREVKGKTFQQKGTEVRK